MCGMKACDVRLCPSCGTHLHVLVDPRAVREPGNALLAKVHERLVRSHDDGRGWPQGVVEVERDDLDVGWCPPGATTGRRRRGDGAGTSRGVSRDDARSRRRREGGPHGRSERRGHGSEVGCVVVALGRKGIVRRVTGRTLALFFKNETRKGRSNVTTGRLQPSLAPSCDVAVADNSSHHHSSARERCRSAPRRTPRP